MNKVRRKDEPNHDALVKLIIIGDSGVGKTNILMRFCESDFKDNYVATIGVDFKIKVLAVDGMRLKLQIWDTAGQQRFKNITQTYYKGAGGIILAYSVTDEQSFDNVEKWMHQIADNTGPQVKKILVGNKSDLSKERKVSIEAGRKLAASYDIPFLEVSARTGSNIDEIFTVLGRAIKTRLEQETQPTYSNQRITQPLAEQSKSRCC